MADIIVLTILAAVIFLVLRFRIRSGRESGCSCGCGGDCPSCKEKKDKNFHGK